MNLSFDSTWGADYIVLADGVPTRYRIDFGGCDGSCYIDVKNDAGKYERIKYLSPDDEESWDTIILEHMKNNP